MHQQTLPKEPLYQHNTQPQETTSNTSEQSQQSVSVSHRANLEPIERLTKPPTTTHSQQTRTATTTQSDRAVDTGCTMQLSTLQTTIQIVDWLFGWLVDLLIGWLIGRNPAIQTQLASRSTNNRINPYANNR
jgi:hypothetical protein